MESGLSYLVKTAQRTFAGREALLERQRSEEAWDMVLLEIEDDDVDPFYSHAVLCDDRVIGIVTSGAYGHRTKKSLALAYLRDTSARDNLSVSILGRKRAARILALPPYDADNTRLRA